MQSQVKDRGNKSHQGQNQHRPHPYPNNRPAQGANPPQTPAKNGTATQQSVKVQSVPNSPASTTSIEQNFPKNRIDVVAILGNIMSWVWDIVIRILLGLKNFVWSNRQWNNSPKNEGVLSGLLVAGYGHSLTIGQMNPVIYMYMQIVAFILALAAWKEKSLPRWARYVIVSLAFIGWAEYQTQGLVARFLGLGYNSIAFLLMPVVMAIVWGYGTIFNRGGSGHNQTPVVEVLPPATATTPDATPENAPLTYGEAMQIIKSAFKTSNTTTNIPSTIAEAIRANIKVEQQSNNDLVVIFAETIQQQGFAAGNLGGLIKKVLLSVGIQEADMVRTWVRTEEPKAPPVAQKPAVPSVVTPAPSQVPDAVIVLTGEPTAAPESNEIPASEPGDQLPTPFNWKASSQKLWELPELKAKFKSLVETLQVWNGDTPGYIFFNRFIPLFNDLQLPASSVEEAAQLILSLVADTTERHSQEPFQNKGDHDKFRLDWIDNKFPMEINTLEEEPA